MTPYFHSFLFSQEADTHPISWFLLRAYVHVRYTEKYQVRLCNLKGEKCCLASALAFELASSCHFQASTEVG